MSLVVQDLVVELGGRRVLDGVSFTVEQGERFGIIGESGSGKTLTALAILGLLPEQARVSGSVRLDDTELLGMPDARLASYRGAELSMVFQEPGAALDPLRRVGVQITQPLRSHYRISRRREQEEAVALARSVRLPDPERLVRAYPHELSGGQRQRVCIAAAIAAGPRCLLADEPTTALDVTVQAEILELFRELSRQRGMSLVFITHDLAVLAEVATRAAVLSHGRIVETAPVQRLLTAPEHPVTQALLAASARTAGGAPPPAGPRTPPGEEGR